MVYGRGVGRSALLAWMVGIKHCEHGDDVTGVLLLETVALVTKERRGSIGYDLEV